MDYSTIQNTVYKIEKITDKNGLDRTDGRYPLRIGEHIKFTHEPEIGRCMLLNYVKWPTLDPYRGVLRTSRVVNIHASQPMLTVETCNSIYTFCRMNTNPQDGGV